MVITFILMVSYLSLCVCYNVMGCKFDAESEQNVQMSLK